MDNQRVAPMIQGNIQVMVQPVPPQSGDKFRYHTHEDVVICQHCGATVTTELTHKIGRLTWWAVCLLFMSCALPCCVIPLCMKSGKDVIHWCPNCKKKVGEHRHLMCS